jgi:hypothetical protein
MNQWRFIVAIAIVALSSRAIWVWHERSHDTDATPAPAEASAPVQHAPVPVSERSVASDAALAPSSPPAEPISATPQDDQRTTSAAVEPPNVDTPEPAERKFASGGRAESDQN